MALPVLRRVLLRIDMGVPLVTYVMLDVGRVKTLSGCVGMLMSGISVRVCVRVPMPVPLP